MTRQTELTIKTLADKVAWEGGVLGALEYGVSADQIMDPEAASLWRRIESLYNELRPRYVADGAHAARDNPSLMSLSQQPDANSSAWESAVHAATNHVLLAVIVLSAEDLLQQEIRPFTHAFSRSEHSG